MGLPVIATNWSGPTAFLDESVGYPLRYDGLVEVCISATLFPVTLRMAAAGPVQAASTQSAIYILEAHVEPACL